MRESVSRRVQLSLKEGVAEHQGDQASLMRRGCGLRSSSRILDKLKF